MAEFHLGGNPYFPNNGNGGCIEEIHEEDPEEDLEEDSKEESDEVIHIRGIIDKPYPIMGRDEPFHLLLFNMHLHDGWCSYTYEQERMVYDTLLACIHRTSNGP